MKVSMPANFSHKVHVGFNPMSGQFTGLPEEWVKLLKASTITKDDYARSPETVIEALDFYSKEIATTGSQGSRQVCALPE